MAQKIKLDTRILTSRCPIQRADRSRSCVLSNWLRFTDPSCGPNKPTRQSISFCPVVGCDAVMPAVKCAALGCMLASFGFNSRLTGAVLGVRMIGRRPYAWIRVMDTQGGYCIRNKFVINSLYRDCNRFRASHRCMHPSPTEGYKRILGRLA